jgi:chemotaxis protein methyltransferase CheR
MDIIFCRNVLMYFTRVAQQASIRQLCQCLAPGGWLAVSPAEASPDLFGSLRAVYLPGAIFYRDPSGGGLADEHERSAPSSRGIEPAATVFSVARPPAAPSPVPMARARDWLASARAAANAGDLQGARDHCLAALVKEPLSVDAQLLLASVSQELGDSEAAKAALRRAIYLAPRSAAAHFALGSLLLSEGTTRDGRRSLRTVIRVLSSEAPGTLVLGTEGLTAERLIELARSLLEMSDDGRPFDEVSA